MSASVLDAMSNAAQWSAVEPDGVTPSTELSIQDDLTSAGYGADGVSARITATSNAAGHSLRRSLAPTPDVSTFTELRLSLRADRPARGGDEPFFLQLRLGSAGISLSDPANTWHRLLPFASSGHWQTVKLGIDDLPAAIAGALGEMELRCVHADPPFTAHVDDVTVVRPEMLADADRALEARLSGISIGGPVPATVRAASELASAAPALDLVNLDVRFAAARVRDSLEARDYTADGGFRVVPVGAPYDITYSITPVAASRAEQAALIEAVVTRIGRFDELVADGDRLPVELVEVLPEERAGGAPGADPVLFYRVSTRSWTAEAPQPVREVSEIEVDADWLVAR